MLAIAGYLLPDSSVKRKSAPQRTDYEFEPQISADERRWRKSWMREIPSTKVSSSIACQSPFLRSYPCSSGPRQVNLEL